MARRPQNDEEEQKLIAFGELLTYELTRKNKKQSDIADIFVEVGQVKKNTAQQIISGMINGEYRRLTVENFLLFLTGFVRYNICTECEDAQWWLNEFYDAIGENNAKRISLKDLGTKGAEILRLIENRKTIGEQKTSLEGVPSLIWHVPHHHNVYFTGREEILTRLHDKFSSESPEKPIALTQPHAISGLGGIGKTQIAIEYAHRYAHEYKAVLWVRADSRESLTSDFAKLATVLNLPRQEDQTEMVKAVLRWLQNNTKWLLTLDNADDISTALDFLPTHGTGHILLTTRSQPTGNKIIGIEVEKMGEEESILFVLRRAKIIAEDASLESVSDTQKKDAKRLNKLLDGLPLALDQAAAYMEEKGRTVHEYLALYETRYKKLWGLRGKSSEKEYPLTVATTWSLNFESVEQNNPAATEVLWLCAFLHPDAIPEELMVSGTVELNSIFQDMADDPIRLDEAIGELLNYSLVRRNPKKNTLTIHRLVQAVLKESMDEQTRRVWAERTVRAINLTFPDAEDVTLWEQCDLYLPHALVCESLMKDYSIKIAEAATLLNNTAYYLYRRAQYTQAEPLLIRALEIREKQLGLDHPDTATSLDNLATLYHAQGKDEIVIRKNLIDFLKKIGCERSFELRVSE